MVPEAVTTSSTFVFGSVHHVRDRLLTKHTLICKYVTSIREKVESMIDVYHSFIIHSTANYRNNNNSDLINTARNITAFINYSVYFCN